MFKKLFALLMVVSMILSMLYIPAAANGSDKSYTFTTEGGGTVTVVTNRGSYNDPSTDPASEQVVPDDVVGWACPHNNLDGNCDICRVAEVNGVKYATLAEALAAAKTMTGDVVVSVLGKATLSAPISGSFSSIKFVGAGETAEIYIDLQGAIYATGKVVAFEDLKLSKVAGGYVADAGFMNLAFGIYGATEVTYTDCTFANGAYASSGKNTFTNCTFYRSHDRYGLWAYGAEEIVVDDCTFADIRGIKMYDEGKAGTTGLTVKNTDFSAADNKPAIVLTYGSSVVLENNTYSSKGVFELDLDGNPNGVSVVSDVLPTCVNDNGACGVLVDGKIYTTVAQAAEVATSGSTVTLLHNSTESVELAEGVTLDKNGYTADGVTVAAPAPTSVEVSTLAELLAALASDSDLPIVITETIKIPAGETVVLDLNGKTVAMADSILTTAYALDNYGTLTLKDSKGNGSISARGIYNHGTMTVESGIYNAKGADGGAAIFNYSVVYIYGGTFTSIGSYSLNNQPGASMTIGSVARSASTGATVTNGIYNTGATLTINNGNIANSNSGRHTIYSWNSNVTINGGSIHNNNSGNSTVMAAGDSNVEINGGEFTINIVDASSSYLLDAQNTASYDISGGTFAGGIRAQGGTTYNISGGTYTNEYGNYNVYTGGNIDITGGTFNSEYAKTFASNNIADGYELSENGIVVEAKVYVAEVNGTKYEDLQEAIKAAAPSGTVELLCDVTVDKWIMISETLTIGNGTVITLEMNGLTIDGNGYTLTVNEVESAGNGNHLFYDGDYSIYDLTINMGDTVNGLGITSGTIKNVTFNGGWGISAGAAIHVSDALVSSEHAGSVTVEGCTFKNNGGAIYFETAQNGLVVNGNTFYSPSGANVIILRGTETFTNNIVVSGRTVNVVSGSPVVSGNDFGDVRLKVYNEATATITDNKINNLVFNDNSVAKATFNNNTLSESAEAALEAVTAVYVAQIGETKYATLAEALNAAAAGTGNVTVEILTDIDLSNVDWTPVTVSAPGYPVVTVNGNNKTITGLNDMLFAGTWAGKSGLIINNLTIKDSNIVHDENDVAGNIGVGAFVGFPQASATITLNNCHLVNSTVKGGHWTGGLIGYAAGYAGTDGPVFMNLTIKNCSVTGSTITGKGSVGGIIGHATGNGWTDVVIEATTVSGNTVTSTGSSTNKAGAVMGTIGAAGQATTVNGVEKTGGVSVSATVSGNTVTSNGTTITTVYGRQGTTTGMLEIAGGSYDRNPIEENVSYAAPAEGYMIVDNGNGTYGVAFDPAYGKVAMIGENYYATLADALAAAQEGDVIELMAGTIEEGTIKLPATWKNITIKGAAGKTSILKDMKIMSADGNSVSYVGITIDGVVFENSNIVMTGWRNNGATYKDWTITNCEFKNINNTTSEAAVHFNVAAHEAVENFTFTNNIIDGALGGSKSGLYLQATGNVVVKNNVINNVAFRPYVIQLTTDDGIADNFTVTGNTFSGTAAGRAQGLGNNAAGTDSVTLVVTGNIFKDITTSQQICYWNFNPETTTADLSKNYYDIDILANPNKIYFNSAAQDAEDLIEMGVYPYYADEAMTELVTAPAIMVTYPDGKIEHYNDMLEAVPYITNCPRLEGAIIKLLSDIEAPGIRLMENGMILDLNGHTYTIIAGTGSQGTNTSGFQIRPEVTTFAKIMNGTIKVAAGAPVVWMFNSYAADFIVEDVTVDCTNMAWGYGNSCYVVVSRAGDNVQFTGDTSIVNFNDAVAGTAINVGGTMAIGENVTGYGTIELDAGAKLTAKAGLDVITAADYKVVYADGVYTSVAKVYVAEVNGDKCETMADIVDTIKAYSEAGIDAVVKFYNDITINKDQYKEFAYGTGNIIFTADAPVTVTLKADFDFISGDIQIKVEKNVTLNVYDNAGGIYVFYGPGMYIEGTIGGGQNWGCLYLAYGKHTVAEGGKLSIGRVHMAWTELTVNGEIDSNYLLVEESTLTLDGALVDANYITDTNNGGLRYGASKIFMINGAVVKAGTMELKHANSVLTMDLTASLTANKVQGAGKIVIDVADFNGNAVEIIKADMSGFTGTVELINNSNYAVYELSSTGLIVKKAVAAIGNVGYATFAEALAAAQAGDTITLLADVTSSAIITIDKAITLDGNGHTLTSTAARAINIDTTGKVVISNLTINAGERAINIINKASTVELNNVTATAKNNAIMIATSAGAVKLTVNDSDLTGLAVINVAGAGSEIVINNTKITNVDASSAEQYGAITVWSSAAGAYVTVNGGSITVADDSRKAYVFPGDAEVYGVDDVGYIVATIGDAGFETLASAINKAKAGETIKLLRDVTISEKLVISKSINIDGNGKTITYTGSDRAIDIPNNADAKVNVTISNLTVDCTASYCQRGINYNDDGALVLNKVTVKGTNVTYALNLPGSSDNCVVEIADSDISGNIALNVWGENATIVANNTIFTAVDNNTVEGYAAVKLNNDGTTSANGTVITINGGKIDVIGSSCSDTEAASNATATGKLVISDTTVVNGEIKSMVAIISYGDTFYAFETLEGAIAKAKDGETVVLIADVSLSDILVINKAITLDGNGHKITSTAARAINVSGANGVTIKNLTINAKGERAINVIQNATNVTIENVTATASNYTVNVASSAPNAVVTIKNSDLTGLNVVNVAAAGADVTVTGGTITCNDQTDVENYAALSLHKDAKNGKITANGVTFDIKGESDKASNGAEGGVITIDGSTDEVSVDVAYISYGNNYYGFTSLADAIAKAKDGETIVLLRDIALSETLIVNKSITIDLNGKTLTGTLSISAVDVVLTAAEGLTVTTDVPAYDVDYSDGAYKLVKDDSIVAVDANGNEYEDLYVALRTLYKNGGKLTLVKDVLGELDITVFEGVTLDLNGYTLETEYITVFNGGYLVDNSSANTGLLKCKKEHTVIRTTVEGSGNGHQIPVWDNSQNGYIMSQYVIQGGSSIIENDDGTLLYKYAFFTKTGLVAQNGASGTDLSVMVRLSWTDASGIVYHEDILFSDDHVKTVLGGSGKGFALTVFDYEAFSNLTFQAIILSGSQMVACTAPVVYSNSN